MASVPPFLLRGVARAIDLMVQVGVMELAFRAMPALPIKGLVTVPESALLYVDAGVGLGALLIYTALAEFLGGATFGKFCCALRVVNEEEAAPSAQACGVRSAAFFIDGLFLGLVAYSYMAKSIRRQRLGDVWGGTYVVWKNDAPDRNAVVGWVAGSVAAFCWVMLSYVVTG